MQLNQLKPKTPRQFAKRVGRGGKRGTTSGKGTKGQASRAGAGIKPGFRGGDNRLWQLFPKNRGASKKPGNNSPHRKHRYFRLQNDKAGIVNLNIFNVFADGQEVTSDLLIEKGIIRSGSNGAIKVLGNGELKKKVVFKGFTFSASAKTKAEKAGATINE